jgi:hypothetical protein
MDDLVEFLRARLDEDEELSRARWPGVRAVGETSDGTAIMGYAWSPERMLREAEAKRAILASYASFARVDQGHPGIYSVTRELGIVLRLLAAVYSDHPDWRQEWAVQPAQ